MLRLRPLLACAWIPLLASCASREPPPAHEPIVVAAVRAPSRAPDPPAPPASALEPLPPPEPETPAPSPFDALAPDAAASQPTPPFVVRSAVVLATASDPNDPFGGDTLMLFDAVVGCAQAQAGNAPPNLSVTIRWVPANKMQFTQISLNQGKLTSYKGAIEVLKAPKTRGAKGKIRLEHLSDGNVEGGELEAICCG